MSHLLRVMAALGDRIRSSILNSPSVAVLLLAGASLGRAADEDRLHFAGTIGSTLPMQMYLRIDGDKLIGSYYYDHVGKKLELFGKINTDGRVYLVEKDETDKVTGQFHATFGPQKTTFFGQWSTLGGARRLGFALHQVAVYRSIEASIPHRIQSSVTYPKLTGGKPWQEAVNAQLRSYATKAHAKFVTDPPPTLANGFLSTIDWLQEIDIALVCCTEEVMSAFASEFQSTDGAHGGQSLRGLNFQRTPDGFATIELPSLFKPGADYVKALSDYCIEDLRSQMASDVTMGLVKEFSEDQMSIFFLTPSSLTIAFEEYEVGSYAEGAYLVSIPASALQDIINPDGALGRAGVPSR